MLRAEYRDRTALYAATTMLAAFFAFLQGMRTERQFYSGQSKDRLQRGLSAAWLCVQAYDVNARLRQDLKLEQERRQAAVKTLLGPRD